MSVTVHPETPRVAVACGCTLGEEAIWDSRSGTLTWVDIENPGIWRYRPETEETLHTPLSEKLGFALLTEDPDVVLAGFKSGVVRLHLGTLARTPEVRPDHPATNRLNSGEIGPDGALYFSTMDDAESEPTGTFHRWDGRALWNFGGNTAVSNGPVLSPDGTKVYTADTARGLIRVHAHEGDAIGPAEPFVRFEEGWGKPDGLTVDAEGHLWVCHYAGSRITRFAPDGTVERIVPMPTALVTKCTFGGPDLTTLYVTTCLRGRDPTLDPMAGHLFVVETDVKGVPAHVFAPQR